MWRSVNGKQVATGLILIIFGKAMAPAPIVNADPTAPASGFIEEAAQSWNEWRPEDPEPIIFTDDPIETADVPRRTMPENSLNLPGPLNLTRTLSDTGWRVDGIGIEAAPNVELRAGGGVTDGSPGMRGDISLRFRF